jgi:predicted nicotinamide N-methyase
VPEILLHKAAPKSGLRRLAEMDDAVDPPYRAYGSAGGLALVCHVLDQTVAARNVPDPGAGSGMSV